MRQCQCVNLQMRSLIRLDLVHGGIGDLLEELAIGRLRLCAAIHGVILVVAEEVGQAGTDGAGPDVWIGYQICAS